MLNLCIIRSYLFISRSAKEKSRESLDVTRKYINIYLYLYIYIFLRYIIIFIYCYIFFI